MAMRIVELTDAKEHLAELVDEARRGAEVVITQQDEPVAKLVPFRRRRAALQPGSAKGLITMSDDFDEPLEDFADYMS